VETLSNVLTDRALYERLSRDSREAMLSFFDGLGPIPYERYLEGLASRKVAGAASAK
jgi:hypothetical protein